ncbi:MAG: hypothetical protein ACXWR1_22450 [Bdellovibrionota bacterium]
MKTLLCFLAFVLSSPAFGGTLNCAAPNLSYSFDATDGGAPRAPIEKLVLEGNTLIDMSPFEGGIRLASLELLGNRKILKTESTLDYVSTTFESDSQVREFATDATLFRGIVTCREVRYVGPQRP